MRYCAAVASRKLIVRSPTHPEHERCSTRAWRECALWREREAPATMTPGCPLLEESRVQYCSAAPVTKYLPLTEPLDSTCESGGYRYCEFYLSQMHREEALRIPAGAEEDPQVCGVKVPARLGYATNHMWIDLEAPGRCHIGVDAFAAQVLGSLEKLNFVTAAGEHHPTAVLTAGGMDFPMTFPERIEIARTNPTLRLHPWKVISDPYAMGWLFEGRTGRSVPRGEVGMALVLGSDSAVWMRHELDRLAAFLRDLDYSQLQPEAGSVQSPAIPVGGLAKRMSREGAQLLFTEFFAAPAGQIH